MGADELVPDGRRKTKLQVPFAAEKRWVENNQKAPANPLETISLVDKDRILESDSCF